MRNKTLVLLAALALAACSSVPPRGGETPRKPGGYYLDDGPHARPPADLDRLPDPEPKLEPIRAGNARPYTVMGRTYVPMTELRPYRATGMASWYGKRYHGRPTASGEIYDMYAMTAAHPILPIPSYARVRSLSTNRSVVVRINDRGPFHSERLIDLSYTAAYKLGILADGSALVEVESIIPGRDARAGWTRRQPAPALPAETTQPSRPSVAQEPAGVYVQLGAFSLHENAASFLARIQSEFEWLAGITGIYPGGGVFRVQAGPYASRGQALRVASRIEQALDLKPVVLTR